MHVLVTGAGGFSGSAIVQSLLQRGHRVTAAIGTRAGPPLTDAHGSERLAVVRGDLATGLVLPDAFDAVVHAAARSAWADVSVDDMIRSNIIGTQRLLQQSLRAGARQCIFLSSLSVYGRIASAVVDEATPVVDPDVYGLTKRIGEEMLASAAPALASLSIRLPGVIGPGSVRNWLTTVLHAARAGREIRIFNPDAPFNNAVHIADLTAFISGLLERQWSGADRVTLGAAGQTDIRSAAQTLSDFFGARSAIHVAASSRTSFLVSSERARHFYGYTPMEIGTMLRRFAAENPSA